ncbi:MAG: ParB/RepB/Spo0J family partition protein [Candidatus Omnitrophica bacterium]|nr:ParB/RepB/Spo0J family partition protein [Candidatus Omnitrophota bacterium]
MDKKALGKGLSALLSQVKDATGSENPFEAVAKQDQPVQSADFISYLATSVIANNPYQPRQNYDDADLQELKISIKEKGILQPIVVRTTNAGFQVVAGQRRLMAARALGLEAVPVFVKNVSDAETLLMALIENIQREDLNVIDEAKAFERLVNEFKLNQDQIAQAVGKDRTTLVNTLRLLKLPAKIQRQIVQEKISMGHARALLGLDNEEAQLKMAEQIIQQSLSVRSVEGLVRQSSSKAPKKTKTQKAKDPDIAHLEDELRKILGTKVTIEDKKGRGKLIVEYYSLNDLDRILGILRKQ